VNRGDRRDDPSMEVVVVVDANNITVHYTHRNRKCIVGRTTDTGAYMNGCNETKLGKLFSLLFLSARR